jgi:nuclease-like protein
MRVVRAGGQYLAGREQRLWVALVAAATIAVGGLAVAAWTFLTRGAVAWAALIALLVGFVASPRIARRLTRVRAGRLGERLVSGLLGSLSDEYWLVNDVMVVPGRGNIDHVLIGPCGVVVIETKRLRGRVRCQGDAWSVNGFPTRSISRQVTAGACSLRYWITERHRDLPGLWVEAVAVFTHPLCRLDIRRPRSVVVVRYSELLGVVRELAQKHRMSPDVAARLARSLGGAQ